MRFSETRALRILRFIFAIQMSITSCACWNLCDNFETKSWTPSWSSDDRDDLICDSKCFDDDDEIDSCCACSSCAVWEGNEIRLNIEDLSISGRNIVLSNNQSTESNVYKIQRRYSAMKEFPLNLCNDINDTRLSEIFISISNLSEYRSKIVHINLEFNEIKEMGDLSCLYKLDTLNLRYNRITFLSNTSFENLSYLRTLDLEGNILTTLEPNTLSSSNLNILTVDLSKNDLPKLDVSNMVILSPFCEYNFEENEITEFVNENNFVLNTSTIYGPGFVNIQDNSMNKFPDLKNLLNIDDLSILGKVWDFGFDFRGIPITCDCSLQPFLALAQDIIEALWRDYFEVSCTAPEHLNGTSIPALNLSELVCPLDAESGCQSPQCTCVDEPNKDTLVIDCSNAIPSLTKFPSIPNSSYSTHISLNLSGNDIKEIPDEPYLSKLSILDLNDNDIREINDSIAGQIENTFIDLRKNDRLLRLPQTFQYRNACSIDVDGIILDCDCDSQWIAEWLKSKACKGSSFYCNVPGIDIIPASSFSVDDLQCSPPNDLIKVISITLSSIIVLSVTSGFILHKFRYEVLIIYLRIRKKREEKYMTHPDFKYDVYITLDENNQDVVSWVENHLQAFLINLGYKVCIPYRDILGGSVRNDEAAIEIDRSRNVLVIMSNEHFQTVDDERPLTDYEWKYAWHNFRKDRCKNIVLVNFDHISAREINYPQVRAFLRTGSCINFKNHDRDIMNQIRKKLGEPQVKLNAHEENQNDPKKRPDKPQVKLVAPCKTPFVSANLGFKRRASCESLTIEEINLQ